MSKIGVGLSTRNKQSECIRTLNGIFQHTDCEMVVAVADDFSHDNTPAAIDYWASKKELPHRLVTFPAPSQQIGIAANKNRLVNFFLQPEFNDLEYIFLIEDDVRPRVPNWQHWFIETAERTQQAHLLYLAKDRWGGIPFGNVMRVSGEKPYQIEWKMFASGLVMFFTRSLLEFIGGFNEGLSMYGYEHNELSNRAFIAQGIRPGRREGEMVFDYPHCVAAETHNAIEADDLNRKPMWNFQEERGGN